MLQAELKMTIRLTPDGEKLPIRIFLTNESGYYLDISVYREITDKVTGETTFESYSGRRGPFHGRLLRTPYFTRDNLQQKRFAAQSNGTTYAYDFPEMFRQALIKTWRAYYMAKVAAATGQVPHEPDSNSGGEESSSLLTCTSLDNSSCCSESQSPTSAAHLSAVEKSKIELNKLMQSNFFSCIELALDAKTGKLVEKNRLPGENDIGMIAWKLSFVTPEYPGGREVIVIANDITLKIGSFGTEEDLLFKRASELARALGVPRIYVSANSGARIGLAEELKDMFKVAWLDPSNPDKGYRYLYLTAGDYERVKRFEAETGEAIVRTELVVDEADETHESRYRITDIMGKEHGIGVENLRGSGMIAGETSLAYDQIPTISLVTCRAVGIGAYLVRLGQRVIQVENSHIILTGASALNKVLGREVYTSNAQLGGVQIMHNNGISHDVVSDDFEGISLILKWLSFMPERVLASRALSLPILLPVLDPVDRLVEYVPTKAAYDPRWMLEGRLVSTSDGGASGSHWLSGFFDRGSFHEIMKAWAKTVVCGRARLGGLPLGVIAVETRTVELQVPADPANLDSDACSIQQAGQVWFPDSAYKTAQAIRDFSREQLPLMIFANWRGFSGGMKDMYEQVIKFGAQIVDGLRKYEQPVIIYIPANGELRGGAWVVVDPSINERHMEMYAERESRGGVLEAEGTVEIKYRQRDLLKTMARLDPECGDLREKIKAIKAQSSELLDSSGGGERQLSEDGESKSKLKALEASLEAREKYLMPVYHQISVTFADLHDTPGRMLQKKVIKNIVDWPNSRKFFYWRFKRLIARNALVHAIIKHAKGHVSFEQAMDIIRKSFYQANEPAKRAEIDVFHPFFILIDLHIP